MRAANEGPEYRMRGYVFDTLAIDPDLAAVADRIPVLLSRADHRRSYRLCDCRLAMSRDAQSAPTSPLLGRAAGTSTALSNERGDSCV